MKAWLIAGALLIAGVGYLIYADAQSAVNVEAARASTAPISQYIDEQGQTRLPHVYSITTPLDGRIEAINLVEGTEVEAGQVVAQLVPTDLQLRVNEAQAAVERLTASILENDDTSVELTTRNQAERLVESMESTVQAAAEAVRSGLAKLEYASRNFKRIRSLRETGTATEEQLNAAEVQQVEAAVDYQQDQLVLSALRSMQAATILVPKVVDQQIGRKALSRNVLLKEREQAQVRLDQALRDQARGLLTSPIRGVVLERLESNERQLPAGSVVLKIGNLAELQVEADVLSQEVVRVTMGDPVEIYGPTIGTRPIRGTVERIYPAGFTKQSSLGVEQQRVKVLIAIAPEDLEQLPAGRRLGVGYRVDVRIITDEKPSATVIPRSALFRGPAGQWRVFVVRRGKAMLQNVEVGLLNDQFAEIIQGVADGEIVVLAPETSLSNGTYVRPQGIE